MSYYLLPRNSIQIIPNIEYTSSDIEPSAVISNSLSYYLYEIKENIQANEKEWDIVKKYTNPYEYIHSNLPGKKKSVSKLLPLSRSFFKMIEIINTFDIGTQKQGLDFFHLAEGPGGFIEAFVKTRKNKDDKYVGMTLIDENNEINVPSWKRAEHFLKENPNIKLEYGKDNTGNILSIENFNYVINKYNQKMDVITADGGFDFSIDFNKQEISITKLLYGQISYALCMQKKGGCFVLKIFDCFMQHTIDLLYILSAFYEKVYIVKPNTSRYANSEKYIVCKKFLFSSPRFYIDVIGNAFQKMCLSTNYASRFLNLKLSNIFITKLEEYNAIFGQQQIENIHYTLCLIENKNKQEKINQLIQTNTEKCIYWCQKHNIPITTSLSADNNIFLNFNSADKYENYFLNNIY
tara:strand:- start:90 stop:1310 length:1221 start_codon:yes stop_codon:yes gene_type:complete